MTQFKEVFCWRGVRIHFVGVWYAVFLHHTVTPLLWLSSTRETVSSLGLIKRDVHVTESTSVTNACHFRHALALDERRVKFMPEYFLEVNALRTNTRSRKPAVSDIKEVWFAGSHSDVYVIRQWMTRIDLKYFHSVVGWTGHMIRCTHTPRTTTPSLTLFTLVTCHSSG